MSMGFNLLDNRLRLLGVCFFPPIGGGSLSTHPPIRMILPKTPHTSQHTPRTKMQHSSHAAPRAQPLLLSGVYSDQMRTLFMMRFNLITVALLSLTLITTASAQTTQPADTL